MPSPLPSPLPIAGIIPFSATDWPGKLTVTVFVQGCPLRCSYCHNPTLQPFSPGLRHFDEALELMHHRAGLLDGLVISGGEPLATTGLGDAVCRAHAEGFEVGLHTSGYSPARLEKLLSDEESRPDWIGLDVKALSHHLPEVAGVAPKVGRAMERSLDLVTAAAQDHGMGVQVRTTVWRGSVVEAHLDELRARVAARGHELVVQLARGCDAHGKYLGSGSAAA